MSRAEITRILLLRTVNATNNRRPTLFYTRPVPASRAGRRAEARNRSEKAAGSGSLPRGRPQAEPATNLDTENAEVLMGLMQRLHGEHGMTFVFSTHDARVVAHASRVVTLQDGRVLSDERQG